jgi:hypothetical protein
MSTDEDRPVDDCPILAALESRLGMQDRDPNLRLIGVLATATLNTRNPTTVHR